MSCCSGHLQAAALCPVRHRDSTAHQQTAVATAGQRQQPSTGLPQQSTQRCRWMLLTSWGILRDDPASSCQQSCPDHLLSKIAAVVQCAMSWPCWQDSGVLTNAADVCCMSAACPAGRYSDSNTTTCKDCPKGSYCPGDAYRPTANPPVIPVPIGCPPNMTTVGMRSISARACGESATVKLTDLLPTRHWYQGERLVQERPCLQG